MTITDNITSPISATPHSTAVAQLGRQAALRMKPSFLNVDLEIVSASRLDSMAAEMGKRVFVLQSEPPRPGRYVLAVETSRFSLRKSRIPDALIHALCSVVESLSPASRRIWKKAEKTFDVGYELRPSERFSRFSVRPDTLERVAKLGATLTVTYYRR